MSFVPFTLCAEERSGDSRALLVAHTTRKLHPNLSITLKSTTFLHISPKAILTAEERYHETDGIRGFQNMRVTTHQTTGKQQTFQ